MGGVVRGRHALVGHDKQQSTKGEREGGVKPLTCWLVLRACSPVQRLGGAAALGLGWGRAAGALGTQGKDGGGVSVTCFAWFGLRCPASSQQCRARMSLMSGCSCPTWSGLSQRTRRWHSAQRHLAAQGL
jgi:hypothetical protein